MADEPTPSGGAIPPLATPATGTPASATPAKLSIEDALAQIEELKRHAANKEQEAQRHGKNLTAAEKRLADYEAKEREVQEAALTELDKASKRATEAEQKIAAIQKQLVDAHVKLAAQALGIINPDLVASALRDKSVMGDNTLVVGDDGMPTNLDESLKALIKGNQYLVAQKAAIPTPEPAQSASTPTQQTPSIPAMNPGRGAITSPTTNQRPGHIPRLSDLYTI